jgi:copper chaperone CopZ
VTRTYIVEGMKNERSVRRIERALFRVDNISYEINLEKNTVVIHFSNRVDDDKVIGAISRAGYLAMRF